MQPQRGCANPPSKENRYASVSLRRLHSSRLFHKKPATFPARQSYSHTIARSTWRHLESPRLRSNSNRGVEDHVHLLARFGRTITQAEWVKELKRVSNLWLKDEYKIRDFEWQGGYADFSVSESNLEEVKRYIASQEEHHSKVNFQDELRALLQRHRIEWDERYVWD